MNKYLLPVLGLALVVALAALSSALSSREVSPDTPSASLVVGERATTTTPNTLLEETSSEVRVDAAPVADVPVIADAPLPAMPEQEAPVTTPAPPIPPRTPVDEITKPQPTANTPSSVYLELRACMNAITNWDGLVQCTKEYGSARNLESLDAHIEEAKSLPPTFLDSLALMWQKPLVSDIEIVEEIIEGDTATLTVVTRDKTMTATVTLKLEQGVWKIDLESWSKVL